MCTPWCCVEGADRERWAWFLVLSPSVRDLKTHFNPMIFSFLLGLFGSISIHSLLFYPSTCALFLPFLRHSSSTLSLCVAYGVSGWTSVPLCPFIYGLAVRICSLSRPVFRPLFRPCLSWLGFVCLWNQLFCFFLFFFLLWHWQTLNPIIRCIPTF